jgi:hypothetical protein
MFAESLDNFIAKSKNVRVSILTSKTFDYLLPVLTTKNGIKTCLHCRVWFIARAILRVQAEGYEASYLLSFFIAVFFLFCACLCISHQIVCCMSFP